MSVLTTIGAIAARWLGELVAPTGCCACDARTGPLVLFCPPCAATVDRAQPDAAGACFAAFEYGGAMTTAIGRLKYQERADLAPRLGAALATAAEGLRGRVDVVVPVPLHARRLAERGYNQAALLAAPVARALSTRIAPRALARARDTPRQARLDRDARLVNLRGAFSTRDGAPVRGARVLLVDDVRTTGTTIEACAAALHGAGARQVLPLVLARRT